MKDQIINNYDNFVYNLYMMGERVSATENSIYDLNSAIYRESGVCYLDYYFDGDEEDVEFEYERFGDIVLIKCTDSVPSDEMERVLNSGLSLPYPISFNSYHSAKDPVAFGFFSYESINEVTPFKLMLHNNSLLKLVYSELADIGDSYESIHFNIQFWYRIKQ